MSTADVLASTATVLAQGGDEGGSLVDRVVGWFADPANWTGGDGVPVRLLEHLSYSGLALLVAAIIAIPLGALIGHTGRGGFFVVGFANGMRALPELGLLILLVVLMGIGLLPVTIALAVLAIPPMLAGAYAGVANVDAHVVDAARGIGMRERDVLLRVELPNALPLLLGGLRSAALQVIATTAVAAYVSFGGLGRYLIDGLNTRQYQEMAAGALLVAVLALVVEGVLALLQRAVVSPGLRDPGRAGRRGTPDDSDSPIAATAAAPDSPPAGRAPDPEPAGATR